MREVSIEELSGGGKGCRSRRVRVVLVYWGCREREWAVERPKTPVPIIRMERGGGEEGVGGGIVV